MGAVGSGRAPRLHVGVTPGGGTLPIARVPNLAEGDRISIKLDLPERPGARMLLVAAFLRGATNPPTKDWFFKSQTWKKGGTELSLRSEERCVGTECVSTCRSWWSTDN